jgi:hypothetical protein
MIPRLKLIAAVLPASLQGALHAADAAAKPNLVYVLADDLVGGIVFLHTTFPVAKTGEANE